VLLGAVPPPYVVVAAIQIAELKATPTGNVRFALLLAGTPIENNGTAVPTPVEFVAVAVALKN